MSKKATVKQRPVVGIVIDYTIRIPDFVTSYTKMRQQISIGTAQLSGTYLTEEDLAETKKTTWDEVRNDQKALEFYEKLPLPTSNLASDGLDITYRKYFYSDEHRIQFLTDWSYNLFGQGSVTNKVDINLINVMQGKLCDVVLIDRCTHTRKIGNTFAFLARAGAFCKQVVFINREDEIEAFAKQKNIVGMWNPYTDPQQVISPGTFGKPTEAFLIWLQTVEKKINS